MLPTPAGEDLFKSLKAGGLSGHGGTPALLYVRERSGIMACPGAAGGGAYHDKGDHSYCRGERAERNLSAIPAI